MFVRGHSACSKRFSVLAEEKLNARKINSLLLDVETRWNSSFDLLERVLHFDEELMDMFHDESYSIPEKCMLTENEFENARACLSVLLPLKRITNLLQGTRRYRLKLRFITPSYFQCSGWSSSQYY